MRATGSLWRDYRCVVISQRIFKRDVQDIRSKLESNLSALRAAAKHQKGFIKSHNYTLSPFLKEQHNQSSVIISEWSGEVDWETWFLSDARRQIARELEPFLVEEEQHTVLSKTGEQVFLL
jgi:heme-degrading monooxygenase HmoA